MKHPLIRAWTRSARGNVAVMFALIAFPLILAVGLAIDASRRSNSELRLQFALDAAALAGTSAMKDATLAVGDIVPVVKAVFQANLEAKDDGLDCSDPDIVVNAAAMSVSVAADCRLATLFGASISGRGDIMIDNHVVSQAKILDLELVLALDLSNSMNQGTRLQDLKAAAKKMAQTLIGNANDDRVRMAFAGYSEAVNAGVYGNRALGYPDFDDSPNDGVDKVCVTERSQPAAFTDDLPGPGKWVGGPIKKLCPQELGVLPLTSSISEFDAAIDPLTALSGTAGQIGIAWSWYLISPKWSSFWPAGSEPASYSDPKTIKALVVMSDGDFVRRYDWTLGSSAAQAQALCAAMRNKGVLIFGVGFDVSATGKATLTTCAGDPARYFDVANGDQLSAAFESIAAELQNVSLSQ